jgi:hypothetical protein
VLLVGECYNCSFFSDNLTSSTTDDSTSMIFNDMIDPIESANPKTLPRKDTLLQVLELIYKIYGCARPNSIICQVLQCSNKLEKRKSGDISHKRYNYKCQGVTRIGTELKRKIVDPFVFNNKEGFEMKKPLLVIIITDGKVCVSS